MSENMKLVRFYLVLLAIVTIGRWGLSLGGAEYDKTHQVFSLVLLTVFSSLYYGMLVRCFVGGGVKRAIVLGATLAIASQLVIFVSTALSYLLGLQTFFNNARALNAPQTLPMGQAMVGRAGGLVVNTIINMVAGALGWLIAGVVPRKA